MVQQDLVRAEQQRENALEDVVYLPLKWLHVPACRPASMYTTVMSAASHWISRQMPLILRLLQQNRHFSVMLCSQREGWGQSHLWKSLDVIMQVLSSAAKQFKELATPGHHHCCGSASQCIAPSGASAKAARINEMIQVKNPSWKQLESLFCFVLTRIISLSILLSP